jgi:SAM-dependent methyltransferase
VNKLRAFVKRIGRFVLWPASRFFDPRFQGVSDAMNQVIVANSESIALLGRSIAEVEATAEDTHCAIGELRVEVAEARVAVAEARELAERASGAYFERLATGSPEDIDESVAQLLNYAESHRGFAAQRRLWFNPPLSLAYEPREVKLVEINERSAEIPHAYRALARLEPGARVLDVGATESLVALSLASLGYDVTALDLRPYPLSHPRLRSVVCPIEDWESEDSFDAILCLSTIEHVGLPAYGAERKDGADSAAMIRMRELTKPGGLLVLTTRFGSPGDDGFQRAYDRPGLEALLDGWLVEELTVIRREDATTWVPADNGLPPKDGAEAVALVTASRPA